MNRYHEVKMYLELGSVQILIPSPSSYMILILDPDVVARGKNVSGDPNLRQ